jgi:DNA helicase-2/ATP-dependent DNA helicase PcrA
MNLEDGIFLGTKAASFVKLIDIFSLNWQGRQISELLSDILDRSGYEEMLRTEGSQDRLDNLAELKQSVYEYETTCGEEATAEHYLSHVALFSNSDTADTDDKVKLMTVHAAKGLEFPYVFLCGMNEGIFPTRRTRTLPGMEEERRLCFVAVTRAEKRLFLSEAEGRNTDGSPRYPSRFLLDIDREYLDYTKRPREELIKDARDYIKSSTAYLAEDDQLKFKIGDRITHDIMGSGTVADIDSDGACYIIKFDSLATSRRISFRAKLERL